MLCSTINQAAASDQDAALIITVLANIDQKPPEVQNRPSSSQSSTAFETCSSIRGCLLFADVSIVRPSMSRLFFHPDNFFLAVDSC
ncbi:hypothetical protein VTN31DRAFT_6138 [Thermomyces dupontii]|uniref:uncharacterized protein n=1 Tax=Talaromyces thermophilus TaxID=28565 RepID=UPI003744A9CF